MTGSTFCLKPETAARTKVCCLGAIAEGSLLFLTKGREKQIGKKKVHMERNAKTGTERIRDQMAHASQPAYFWAINRKQTSSSESEEQESWPPPLPRLRACSRRD